MRFISACALALVLLAADAFAQTPSYTITVSPNDLAVIGQALDAMPYKEVRPVVDTITKQIQAQNQKMIDERKAAEKAKKDGDTPKDGH